MTATASSITAIGRRNLINSMLRLPEEEFWHIVELRLNLPPSFSSSRLLYGNEHIEYLTKNALVEELFLQLACTKNTAIAQNRISRKCMVATDYKYYRQALELRRWIPIARPAPAFIVDSCDLSAKILAELKILEDAQIVLKQAVGRIFENIDARQYHFSIAQFLEVVLK
jgi:hypothetical protein